MKNNQPLVTFIMSTYMEKTEYLNKSIRSVFNQNYKNIELILVDDGNDELNIDPKLIKKLTLLKNSHNRGLAYSLNKAIKKAAGKYIARIDSDDINFQNRIDIQINTLIKNPDIDVVGSSVLLINSADEPVGLRMGPTFHDTFLYTIWKEVSIPHPTWLVKKDWYIKNNLYKNLYRGQDQYLLLKNYKNSNYYCITQPLVAYRLRKVNPFVKFRGRLSIILGQINGKLYKYLFYAFIYHSLAFFWDIVDYYFNFNKGAIIQKLDLNDKLKYDQIIVKSINN